jgi:hypothetical protein
MFIGNNYIYIGGSNWIKVSEGLQQWDRIRSGELIKGKKYKTSFPSFGAPGNTLIKENSELDVENSWKYYNFCTITNEFGQNIFIEEVFLKEIED